MTCYDEGFVNASDPVLKLWPKRVFYGWAIVGASVAAGFAQVGVFSRVISVFINPLTQEFGWSRAEIAAAISVGGLAGAMLSPLIGPYLDRRGARTVLVVGQLLLGIAMLLTAFVGSLWQFYLTYGLARAVQSVASLAMTVGVANWFRRGRSLALSVSQLGARAASVLLPLLAQSVIQTAGWRQAFVVLGILMLVVGVLPAALVMRRAPEDVGLSPDGDQILPQPSGGPSLTAPVAPTEDSWTLAEARRTPALWFLTLAIAQAAFVGGAVNLHLAPYLMDQGLPASVAVGALSLFAGTAAFGSLVWATVTRWFSVRVAIAGIYLGVALILNLFTQVHTAAGVYLAALMYGLLLGGWDPLANSLWAEYYGRGHLGAITGFTWPGQVLANALGPVAAGIMFDALGSYTLIFRIFAAGYAAAAVWILLARPPRRRLAR